MTLLLKSYSSPGDTCLTSISSVLMASGHWECVGVELRGHVAVQYLPNEEVEGAQIEVTDRAVSNDKVEAMSHSK